MAEVQCVGQLRDFKFPARNGNRTTSMKYLRLFLAKKIKIPKTCKEKLLSAGTKPFSIQQTEKYSTKFLF